MALDHPADAAVKRYKRGRPTKPRPLTREALDSRTAAAKMWDSLAASIIADAGGESEISTVQRTLIDAFCGVAIRLNDLNTKGLLGQPVDLSELSLVASTLTRLASRIGVARVPRDIGPTLGELLRREQQIESAP
jgi:hypothetical protein